MARNVERTRFRVSPVSEGDKLKALQIQKTRRFERVSEDGRTLDYGHAEDIGEPLEIPVHQLTNIVRQIVSWAVYFADGNEEE